jgi:hypothetical protein
MNNLCNPLAFVFGAGMVAPGSVPTVWPTSKEGKGRKHCADARIEEQILIGGAELGPRDLKKMDRMALLALCAARQAWRNAGCEDSDRALCGVMSGNAVAGWTFTEPQLRKLYSSGVDNVSPYLASAWFPAAPQGQISIHMNLRGYAKTVVTDRCAGTQAIGLAAEAISAARGERFLAGASEAPLTPFVEDASANSGQSRTALAEGAAYLVLGTARANRLPIAGIYAHATTVVPGEQGERSTHCLQFLEDLLYRVGNASLQVDVLIDSPSFFDRTLLKEVRIQRWVRRAWWVADFMGDALAATGPMAAAALCRRYAAAPHKSPAILISLGSDFASAIVVAAAVQEQEDFYVSH